MDMLDKMREKLNEDMQECFASLEEYNDIEKLSPKIEKLMTFLESESISFGEFVFISARLLSNIAMDAPQPSACIECYRSIILQTFQQMVMHDLAEVLSNSNVFLKDK